jgi:hypothetical protein
MLKRIVIVVAALFGVVALGAILIPSTPDGVKCGSVVSPDWTDEQIEQFTDADDVSDFGGYGAEARAIASIARSNNRDCSDARSTRKVVAGSAVGLAVVAPLALLFVAGGRKEDEHA